MAIAFGQVIFLKLQRILLVAICLCCVFLIVTLYSTLQLGSTLGNNEDALYQTSSDNIIKQGLANGRPDLVKYIHLDLKGAPPKADVFYDRFFQFLNNIQMGVKGVLIEYEDTLPLQDKLVDISHHAAYKTSDIELIQTAGKKHGLTIIPLIQTFGHLEWILKLEKFKSYRDDPKLPNVISPCIKDTYTLLGDLLNQTLQMHPDSDMIHIGCDEVGLKYSNPACSQTSSSLAEVYVGHVRKIVNFIRSIRPGIRILIWDDILRAEQFVSNKKLLNEIRGLVEPVSWNYFTKFTNYYRLSPSWNIYPKFFTNNWMASAFKGGLHRFSMITNTSHHVLNNLEWLRFIEASESQRGLPAGVILTGWSRFDHFMPLCDLLPTSYPSLLYSLHMLNTGQYIVDDSLYNCEELIRSISKDPRLCDLMPGISIWSGISSLSKLLKKVQNRLKILNTIAPKYNRKHLFVRRHELQSRLAELKVLRKDLVSVKSVLNRHFMELYTNDVADEWFELYLTPIVDEIDTTFTELSSVNNITTWERRPLPQ